MRKPTSGYYTALKLRLAISRQPSTDSCLNKSLSCLRTVVMTQKRVECLVSKMTSKQKDLKNNFNERLSYRGKRSKEAKKKQKNIYSKWFWGKFGDFQY